MARRKKTEPQLRKVASGFDGFEDIAVYLADCVVELQRTSTDTISRRSLRIRKDRGSAHTHNWIPYVIGRGGIEIDPA